MPYLFGGLVVLNAVTLGYYLFLQQPSTTQTLKAAKEDISQPLTFTTFPLLLGLENRLVFHQSAFRECLQLALSALFIISTMKTNLNGCYR